jgi:hypothetical protein
LGFGARNSEVSYPSEDFRRELALDIACTMERGLSVLILV